MHLSNSGLVTNYSHLGYLPWLVSFCVATTIIILILVIVIIICSSYQKQEDPSLCDTFGEAMSKDIFVIGGSSHAITYKSGLPVRSKAMNGNVPNWKQRKSSVNSCCFCCKRKGSTINMDEEISDLLPNHFANKHDNVYGQMALADEDLENRTIIDLSKICLDGTSTEYDSSRLSCIDRELPPLPAGNSVAIDPVDINSVERNASLKLSNDSIPEMVPVPETEIFYTPTRSSLHSNSMINIEIQQSEAKHQSANRVLSGSIESTSCCCDSRIEMSVADDISSTDYDPTYAMIKRKKPSCPFCGAPSIYTPAHSNRNSNLSLQLNSFMASPTKFISPPIQRLQNLELLSDSTYASIAKLPKVNQENQVSVREKSNSSTIKRQRSISQGDILPLSMMKHGETAKTGSVVHDNSFLINCFMDKNEPIDESARMNTISIWSLRGSNNDGSLGIFPLIPKRCYGQSVVDLIDKMRSSVNYDLEDSDFTRIGRERSFSPTFLFSNTFKRRGSLFSSRSRVWTPPSCKMTHCNFKKSSLCSPLKIYDTSKYAFFDATTDLLEGTLNSSNSFVTVKSYQKLNTLFHPVLTPPISPMAGADGDTNNETSTSTNKVDDQFPKDSDMSDQPASPYDDLDYGNVFLHTNERESDTLPLCSKDLDYYDYLSDKTQNILNETDNMDESPTNPTGIINIKQRPASVNLYDEKDKNLTIPYENFSVFDFSSVQMSPLIEQSLENSSSKTTLSSLSFHHFNRLLSSEDSCAKSPLSAEPSPSLEKFEISPSDNSFLFNNFPWSNFNTAFDDYETFE